METLYNINKFTVIVTILLYLTIFLGLYAQIVLGIVQVISSILLLFYWKRIPHKLKQKVYLYWIITCVYGLFWLLNWDLFNSSIQSVIFIVGVVVIPLIIAILFLLLLEKIKNHSYKLNHIQ